MNKERIDDLVDILGDDFAKTENVFVVRNQLELLRYVNEPKKWKAKQLANRDNYKSEIIKTARDEIARVKKQIEKVYLVGYQEINKDTIEISKTEIKGTIPKSLAKTIAQAESKAMKDILMLANLTLKTHTETVRLVSALSTPDNLYDVIKQQTLKGINKGMKVVYKDGRSYSFKAYMEMNARTTIHQELGNEQIKAGADVGQVFYMCDSFGDCAPDHVDYQGKLYYNADTELSEDVTKYINSNGIVSMQSVRDGFPFLTTRPNCRHSFHAIPTSEVMGGASEKKIAEENKLVKGNYKGSNYEKVQEQRLNERTIRFYKDKAESMQSLYENTKDNTYLIKANSANAKVSEWQAKNRELIKDNPKLLKRDYDRESIKSITNDIGVRYDIRKEVKKAKDLENEKNK